MKANDMFSMFLEVVGYLVICWSAGYLIVHLLVWLDGAVNWAVARWWKRKRSETEATTPTATPVTPEGSVKAGASSTDGKGGQL